jgi:hypothetical protein
VFHGALSGEALSFSIAAGNEEGIIPLYLWKVLKIRAMQGSPVSRIDFSWDEESVTLFRG